MKNPDLKKALLKNTLASSFAKVSVLTARLLQVPLFLGALSADEYGRWIILSSLSTWLTLSNSGFGGVAINDMSLHMAAGSRARARTIFSSTLTLSVLVSLGISGLFMAVAPYVPWEVFLKTDPGRHPELMRAAIGLVLSLFIGFPFESFVGKFRAAKKNHQSVYLISLRPWLELLCVFVVLSFTRRLDYIALGLMVSSTVHLLLFIYFGHRAAPDLRFGFRKIDPALFPYIFRKGAAFQGLTLGNALLFQGNLFIIQSLLGPAAVVVFSTVRTLVRSVNQLLEMVNQILWPELTHLLGGGHYERAARLHRLGVMVALLLSGTGTLFLLLFGRELYTLWTGKSIATSGTLFVLFIFQIPLNALWYTSSVVHTAFNKHEGLSARYLLGTVLSMGACLVLSYFWGIKGAALSTVVVDLVLLPYVFRRSLELTKDPFGSFLSGTLQDFRLLMHPYQLIKGWRNV